MRRHHFHSGLCYHSVADFPDYQTLVRSADSAVHSGLVRLNRYLHLVLADSGLAAENRRRFQNRRHYPDFDSADCS